EVGGAGASSAVAYDLRNATVSTEGDNSAGILIDALIGQANSSTTTTAMENVEVTTLDPDSVGIRIGDPDVDLGGAANISGSSRSQDFTGLDISTAGDRSVALALYGFGDESVNTETLTQIATSEISTEGD